jgi:hypothetical protein
MRIIVSIWMFYRKLILPVLSMSVAINFLVKILMGSFSFELLGMSYIILAPMFHYFIYEIRNPNEYYFYYNMGITKPVLWLSTVILSLFIGLILTLI